MRAPLIVLAILVYGLAYPACGISDSGRLPLPPDGSAELRSSIESNLRLNTGHARPLTPGEFEYEIEKRASVKIPLIRELLKNMRIKCEKGHLAGVPVFTLEPPRMPSMHRNKILLYLHGGGYIFNPGEAGLDEGIYMAAIAEYKVLAVDYRLAPRHPFPAALDDALAVYKALLESYPAENIGVFGSSTGGALTLSLCLLAKREDLPMPGAIAPGTPWSDLSKTGDSYFINEGVDNMLVSYDDWLGEAANAYANGRDLKDPLLSPIYGDLSGLPPAILVTGTRDLFLSNTARMHRKLREAGTYAELLVIEGLSHWQYVQLPPDAPETQYYFKEAAKFFDKFLGR